MKVRRLWLIPTLICVLGLALLIPTTSAHAQTYTRSTSQQQTVANDLPGYRFDAGFWGYGYCFSSAQWQKSLSDAQYMEGLIIAALSWDPPKAVIAYTVIEGRHAWMESLDTGNGACVGFVFGVPAAQWYWGRK